MSRDHGAEYDDPKSAGKIDGFIKSFKLNRGECLDSSWPTFNRFFSRRLKPDARPIAVPKDPSVAVQPADSRLVVFPSVDDSTRLWIKGKNFTLRSLLDDDEQVRLTRHALFLGDDKHAMALTTDAHYRNAKYFQDGSISVHRLAPQDYHRFHCPIDCTIGDTHCINGELWTVNPVAVNAVDVFTENKRNVTYLESDVFGRVALIAVGAHMVGSILYTGDSDDAPLREPVKGARMTKGQDMGFFQFGGSTVICVWRKGAVAFDADLLAQSEKSTEVLVKVGQTLGIKAN